MVVSGEEELLSSVTSCKGSSCSHLGRGTFGAMAEFRHMLHDCR
jgi:hypothetical protein